MVPEAKLQETENGTVPAGDGWFVLNARDARWYDSEPFGQYTRFEGEHRFPELGINLSVLHPGKPSCMYHRENKQEDFLVLAGECLLLVEGEERLLGPWDLVHCPPWTEHVFVGSGSEPCHILSVGARPDTEVVYPAAEFAQRRGAAVRAETPVPSEAYAAFAAPVERPYQEGDLPNL